MLKALKQTLINLLSSRSAVIGAATQIVALLAYVGLNVSEGVAIAMVLLGASFIGANGAKDFGETKARIHAESLKELGQAKAAADKGPAAIPADASGE